MTFAISGSLWTAVPVYMGTCNSHGMAASGSFRIWPRIRARTSKRLGVEDMLLKGIKFSDDMVVKVMTPDHG